MLVSGKYTFNNYNKQSYYESFPEPKECNMQLIQLYSHTPNSNSNEKRNPIAVSELLQLKCKKLSSSCCLDSEFETMTRKIKFNIMKIAYGINKLDKALQVVKNIDKQQIHDFVDHYINRKKIVEGATGEDGGEIYKGIWYIRKNDQAIIRRMKDMVKYMSKYSASLNCSICEAKNHAGLESDVADKKLILNTKMCSAMYNSIMINEFSTLIMDFIAISMTSQALLSIYNVNMEIDIEKKQKMRKNLIEKKNYCMDNSKNLADFPACMEFCRHVIPFNKSIMQYFGSEQSIFVILVTDYFGSQKLLKSDSESKKGSLLEQTKDSADQASGGENRTAKDAIRKFWKQIWVHYFLMPWNAENPMNLNNLPVVYSDTLWFIRKSRYRKWNYSTKSGFLLSTVFGFLFGILFLSL